MAERAERFEAGGVVAAGLSAVVTSRVVAPVIEVRVRAGDRVRAGQVLVVLDDRDLSARVREARAAAVAAEQGLSAARTEQTAIAADRRLAIAWRTRIASLHERNSATAQELDEAEARLSSTTARAEGAQARIEQATSYVAAARAAAEAAETTQSFALVRAPFDGLVTETLTDPGNLASPGAPLARVESVGAPRVEVTVDEKRAAYVKTGDRAEVTFDSVEGNGTVEQRIDGVVIEIARAVALDRRAFTVKVSLPRERAARTGTFARVRFSGPARKALLVPADAIRQQGQIATVFVVDDNVAWLRLVQTGLESSDGIEVVAGLDENETVVISPPPELRDGRRVTSRATRSSNEERR